MPRSWRAAALGLAILTSCATAQEYVSEDGYRLQIPPGWSQGFGFEGPLGRVSLSLRRGEATLTLSLRPRESEQPFDRLGRVLASGLRGASVNATTADSRPAVLVRGWLDETWTSALFVEDTGRLLVITASGPPQTRGEIESAVERLRRTLRIRA